METAIGCWIILGGLTVLFLLLRKLLLWLLVKPRKEEPVPQYVYMTDAMYGRLMGSYGRAETDAANKQKQIDQLEEEKKRAEQPPPNMEQLAQAVTEKYFARRRLIESAALDELERKAALEKAKQQYLRELNEVMH